MDKDTMRYLEIVRDLESERVVCRESIAFIDSKLRGLGHPAALEEPVKGTASETKPDMFESFIAGGGIGLVACLFFGPGLVLGLEDMGIYLFAPADELFIFPVFAVIGGIIACLLAMYAADKDRAERQTELNSQYKQAMADYRKRKKADEERMRREGVEAEALCRQRKVLEKKDAQTAQLLEQAYAQGVIKPKYRSLSAVCRFIDYFENEICDGFAGPFGANARYDIEAPLNQICASLEDIKSMLRVVVANQYTLNEAYNSIKSQVEGLNSSMGRFASDCGASLRQINSAVSDGSQYLASISADSAAARWSAEQARKELAYKRWLDNPHDYRRSL